MGDRKVSFPGSKAEAQHRPEQDLPVSSESHPGAARLFCSASRGLGGDSWPWKLSVESGCYKAALLRHTPTPDKHPPTGRPGSHMATRASCQNVSL